MLRRLYIKNYALIQEITVEFGPGLSIITGETGAGKSILMDAISLLIGERASADLIRRGESKAIVEAEFGLNDFPSIKKYLRENSIECDSEDLIIRRELNLKSAARAFVNDSPVSIPVLKELGNELIDLHGQHEHQSLLHPEWHIDFLDQYAGLLTERKTVEDLFFELSAKKNDLNEILRNKEVIQRERSFYEFQLQEIKAVDPKPNEDEEIEGELSKLEHSEELQNLTGELYEQLYDAEDSVHSRLASAKNSLERLQKIDHAFAAQIAELSSASAMLDELAHVLSRYGNSVEADPERLEELRNRQIALSRLKKKYGPSLDDLLVTYSTLQGKAGDEGNIAEQIEKLEKEIHKLESQAASMASGLSASRKRSAKAFEKKIVSELRELGIENGEFIADFQIQNLTRTGIDHVEFFISANKGESPKPLVKVASGGEVSRIMLALKTVLSGKDRVPLMIFDEIDTGISGRIAQKVGKAMKALAGKHQIIAITHLGQIAAFADTHYVVEKSSHNEVTSSTLKKLSRNEHEEEIAKLISGAEVTAHSLKAARSLVEEAASLAA